MADWCFLFFFKQKTAYEMRISDWSSDVCSSDLDEQDADEAVGELAWPPGLRFAGPQPPRDDTEQRHEQRDADAADRQAEVGEPGAGAAHPVGGGAVRRGVERGVGAVIGDKREREEQREKPERHRRRDHQRSRDALAENRAPIGLCGCGLAACHALFRSCQLTTAICAWGDRKSTRLNYSH